MNTWHFSDPHFGHINIMKYCSRPFEDITSCDHAILRNINSVVQPGDLLVCHGDFCFGGIEKYIYYRGMIRCKNVILIRGNHDYNIPKNKLEQVFTRVEDVLVLGKGSKMVFCAHYPMVEWAHSFHKVPLLYGHNHEQQLVPNGWNTAVDLNDFKPLLQEEAIRLAKETTL